MSEPHKETGAPSADWKVWFQEDPFCEMIGPIYVIEREDPREPVRLGMRIEQRHCNSLGFSHGGTLLTFIDTALGYVAARANDASPGGPTISITVNFMKPAMEGDWIESRVEIERPTRTMHFVHGNIVLGERTIAQATGIFVRPAASRPA
jgi:uncharacterized protein (TIGR00369 family)